MRGAEDILRSRFAACGRMLDIGHGLLPAAGREQDEAQVVLGLQMALLCCAAIPGFGLAEIVRDAAAQLVRLTEVELRIGVAGDGERAPFGDGRRLVPELPGPGSRLQLGRGTWG